MPSLRSSTAYAGLGILCLVLSLILAFSSSSLVETLFGAYIRIDPYSELLSVVLVGVGGFFMFQAGRSMPQRSILKKTLVEQVKSVEEKAVNPG